MRAAGGSSGRLAMLVDCIQSLESLLGEIEEAWHASCLLTCRIVRDEEADVTLRITHEGESILRATLRLEGNLVGEWAALLEHECSDLLNAATAVSLDLTGVRLVDRAGVEVLGRLSRAGVEVHCRPGAVANVLEGEGITVKREAGGKDGAGRQEESE